jgi:hypothetical protein
LKTTRFLEALPNLVFAIAGLVVAGIHFRDLIGVFSANPLTIAGGLSLIVFLISLQLGIYGIQHARSGWLDSQLTEVGKSLKDAQNVLSRCLGGRYLNGSEVYHSRKMLWADMETHARTVISGGPKAPTGYVEFFAEHLSARKKYGNEVRYDVVMVLDSESVNAEQVNSENEERREILSRYGVMDNVHVRVIETHRPLNLDILIIDERHVNIGIPTFGDSHALTSGIEFRDQPNLAADLVSWFDAAVRAEAQRFTDWYKLRTTSR